MAGTEVPQAQGLYDPAHEHDSCGFGFVVDIKGRPSHDIVVKALEVLVNLEHRLEREPLGLHWHDIRGSVTRSPRSAVNELEVQAVLGAVRDQAKQEVEAEGFMLSKVDRRLPRQHVLIFTKTSR